MFILAMILLVNNTKLFEKFNCIKLLGGAQAQITWGPQITTTYPISILTFIRPNWVCLLWPIMAMQA